MREKGRRRDKEWEGRKRVEGRRVRMNEKKKREGKRRKQRKREDKSEKRRGEIKGGERSERGREQQREVMGCNREKLGMFRCQRLNINISYP